MMKIFNYPLSSEWNKIVQRPSSSTGEKVMEVVKEVLNDVKTNGESALLDYNKKFDHFSGSQLLVSNEEFNQAENEISQALKDAIELAYTNIYTFHKAQLSQPIVCETQPGVRCWQKSVPIDRVGLYVPGGTAPLFSTVLMLAIPAQIAGCAQIVLCTPPSNEGKINSTILYACKRCGILNVFKTGGAQAIAAMAYGTASIPAVDKIFGPGNQFVTLAKQLVSTQGVAIDMPAGPSEVEVLADESAIPAFIASDLLSQAEHGTTSQVLLISTSASIVAKVSEELEKQLNQLPRKEIAIQALENSRAVIVHTLEEAIDLTNQYGPEHLIISCKDYLNIALKIRNAGSVFLGNYTPESVGDYASGTNHTLPTNGNTKAYSGVNMDSFMKKITFQELTQEGLNAIGSAVQIMAEHEHLDAHKHAVTLRLKTNEHQKHLATKKEIVQFSLKRIIRKNIELMAPYSSARSEYTGNASIFLDANESPFNAPYNRYPDPLQKKLKEQIALIKGVPSNTLFLGNGSDEAIDLVFRCFCEPRESNVIAISPSYGMYQVAAETNDISLRKALLTDDFQLDIQAIKDQIDHNSRLIFLCSPNNPSGNSLNIEDVLSLCNFFSGLIIVDEAYIDFSSQPSLLKQFASFPNLIIFQTFSKAWGMAGIRLGMAFAHPSIIKVMNKVKYPYNINMLTQEKGLELLKQEPKTKETIAVILEERALMNELLVSLPFVQKVYPSDANFILIKVNDANKIYNYLVNQSIIVRNRHSITLCENCLRITIGTPQENENLIDTLQKLT